MQAPIHAFSASPYERTKVFKEKIARCLMLGAALALIIPVLTIIVYLFVKAAPVLTPSYIWENPGPLGKTGGIWLPLMGTFYLVLLSLVIVAPIGILAGIYLNEYAPDNWLTRAIGMAVTSLAGVPSIVHALFGVGAFVLTLGMGKSLMAAACTIAVMTIPVIVTATREALAAVDITVHSAQPVTWRDGSMGCPEEGMAYSQALVPGYRVILRSGDTDYAYHAGRNGRFILCETPAAEGIAPPDAGGQAVE